MVYCVKCGTKNEDEAQVCVKCGVSLHTSKRVITRRDDDCFGPHKERHVEEECFGLPHGGAIFAIIFGIIILILGAAWILSSILDIAIDVGAFLGPFMMIAIGILIIAGVAYRFSRRL